VEENIEKNCNVNGSSSLFSGTIVEENTLLMYFYIFTIIIDYTINKNIIIINKIV
jgi:hypothetical protein